MSAVRQRQLISVSDYLAAEAAARRKHEYVAGRLYAMAGASNAHNIIAVNVLAATRLRLRSPCRPFNSDTKVRVADGAQVRFYYPDAMIVCRPNPQTDSFHDQPAALFEVLSEGTRRIDEGEKQDAYLTIPSLNAYVLIEQDAPAIVVYRRTPAGFEREEYTGLAAVIPLGELGIDLPLSEIYADVQFAAFPP